MQITSSPTNRNRRIRALVGVGAFSLVAGLAFGACSDDDDPAADAAATTSTTLTTVAPVDGGDASPVDVTTDGSTTGGSTTGGGTTGGTTGGGDTTGGQTPSGPPPVITSFVTPENIDCHNGNFQEFSASWTTTGAASTTISIDGPGVYKTYGPNEPEADLPFNCSSPHTFLLTATGADGQTATQSITLQPRNAQAPGSDEDPPEDD